MIEIEILLPLLSECWLHACTTCLVGKYILRFFFFFLIFSWPGIDSVDVIGLERRHSASAAPVLGLKRVLLWSAGHFRGEGWNFSLLVFLF